MRISVVIIAKNEQDTIGGCLVSVGFADDVVLVDDNSTDNTVKIAKQAGARIFKRKLDGFATQKNFGINKTKNDWVLILDADEELSRELQAEIKSLVPPKNIVAYDMAFRNYVGHYWLRYGGMYPDKHVRLFNKNFAHYGQREIHETLDIKGKVGHLKHDVIHYTYKSYNEYLAKVKKYAALEAESDTKKPSFIEPARTFYIKLVKEKGYKDRLHGLRSAVLLSYYPIVKRKLMK